MKWKTVQSIFVSLSLIMVLVSIPIIAVKSFDFNSKQILVEAIMGPVGKIETQIMAPTLVFDPSTEQIILKDVLRTIYGSGVIIDKVGGDLKQYYILTAFHVVDGAQLPAKFIIDDEEYRLSLIRFSKELDLAVLSFFSTKDLPVIELCSKEEFNNIKIMDQLYSCGYPFGTSKTIESGFMSPKDKNIKKIRTTCPIYPGFSGGGVFAYINGKYKLVGINLGVPVLPGLGALNTMSFAAGADLIHQFLGNKL